MRDHPCEEYGTMNRRHTYGEWTTMEERGVLVVTHGKRAGRIYAVEQTVKERTCSKCSEVDVQTEQPRPFEWPGGIR